MDKERAIRRIEFVKDGAIPYATRTFIHGKVTGICHGLFGENAYYMYCNTSISDGPGWMVVNLECTDEEYRKIVDAAKYCAWGVDKVIYHINECIE